MTRTIALPLTILALAALHLPGCIITATDPEIDTAGSQMGTDGPEESAGDTDSGNDAGSDDGLDETGAEEDELERPDGARELISDEDLQRLIDKGAVVYPGSTPPDVSGVFDVTGGVVAYHDREWIEGTPTCYMLWTLETTSDPELYLSSTESYRNCSGTSEGQGNYISGKDDCFTLYGAVDGERDGCEYQIVGIVSGCLTDEGIADKVGAQLAGPLHSVQPGSCEALIEQGLMGDEGEIAVLEYDFVSRVEG